MSADMDDEAGKKRKRAHNRTFQTLLASSKIRHLKKKDGEPLWRADIQYDLLNAIFTNPDKVFTNSYTGEAGQSFADIYIDAMARSSRCSRVLREKLLAERTSGIGIAMVCLLVNIGRMNTTLNFFPEMKAQLRTYHPIPSLQSHDTADYKQLQDAPRLKSILKGACEDRVEPSTFEQLMAQPSTPRTNPVNLIFLMSTFAHQVEDLFFEHRIKFFELLMNKDWSSESRARAFLWLMWAYLETDLSPEQLSKNPFGPNRTKIPELVPLSDSAVARENIDPPSEISFGNQMTLQRLAYLEGSTQQPVRRVRTAPPIAGNGNQPTKLQIPPAATAYAKLVHHEFSKLLRAKRRRRRTARHNRGDPFKDCWNDISDMDPIYDSDSEYVVRRPHPYSPTLKTIGPAPDGDYGEQAESLSRVFEAVRRLV